MWKGPMKCPLVAHSSKWDSRQNKYMKWSGWRERGKERERLIPIYVTVIFYLDHCRWLLTVLSTGQGQVQIWLYVKVWTPAEQTLHGSLHDILIWPSLRHSVPPTSQFSLRFPESSFQPPGPCIYWSLCPQCSCPEFPGPPFYHSSIFFMDLLKASFLEFIIYHYSCHHLAFLCVFVSLALPSVRINLIILVSYIIYRIPFTRA